MRLRNSISAVAKLIHNDSLLSEVRFAISSKDVTSAVALGKQMDALLHKFKVT